MDVLENIDGSRVVEARLGLFGRSFAETEDGRTWTKSRNGEWQRHHPYVDAIDNGDLCLILAIKDQVGDDAPDHWCLSVSKEGQEGSIYEVKGDATFMQYFPSQNQNVLSFPEMKIAIVLNANLTSQQHERVQYWAEQTPPPQAPNVAAVRANCQHWSIRVLEQLRDEGIIKPADIDKVKVHKQLLPYERLEEARQ